LGPWGYGIFHKNCEIYCCLQDSYNCRLCDYINKDAFIDSTEMVMFQFCQLASLDWSGAIQYSLAICANLDSIIFCKEYEFIYMRIYKLYTIMDYYRSLQDFIVTLLRYNMTVN
jgi:hypothetical protein